MVAAVTSPHPSPRSAPSCSRIAADRSCARRTPSSRSTTACRSVRTGWSSTSGCRATACRWCTTTRRWIARRAAPGRCRRTPPMRSQQLDAGHHFTGLDGEPWRAQGMQHSPARDRARALSGRADHHGAEGRRTRRSRVVPWRSCAAPAPSAACASQDSRTPSSQMARAQGADVVSSAAREEIRWFLYRSWVGCGAAADGLPGLPGAGDVGRDPRRVASLRACGAAGRRARRRLDRGRAGGDGAPAGVGRPRADQRSSGSGRASRASLARGAVAGAGVVVGRTPSRRADRWASTVVSSPGNSTSANR